jgi:hypothetical protein
MDDLLLTSYSRTLPLLNLTSQLNKKKKLLKTDDLIENASKEASKSYLIFLEPKAYLA